MSVSLAPRATARRTADELRALAERGNEQLGSLTDQEASPAEVVRWVAENFGVDAAAVACSMADAALPHLVAEQLPGVDVLFLDTGYHFAETRATRDEVRRALDVRDRRRAARADASPSRTPSSARGSSPATPPCAARAARSSRCRTPSAGTRCGSPACAATRRPPAPSRPW